MTDPGRSGYAVSAGKDGESAAAVQQAAVQGSATGGPDLAVAITHLSTAISILEAVKRHIDGQ